MTAIIISSIIAPILALTVGFLFDVVKANMDANRKKKDEVENQQVRQADPVIGVPVQPDDWDDRMWDMYQSERRNHELCHQKLSDNNLTIPHN